MICDLQDAGLEVVPADMLPAIRCLAREKPLLSDVTVLQSDWGHEWRLFADVALVDLDHVPLDPQQLMSMLWKPNDLVDPTQSTFHRWVAFRRAYDLTRSRNFDAAWQQIKSFEEPPDIATPLQKEVINLRAYLILARFGDEKVDQAISLLKRIRRSPVANRNLKLLMKRKSMTKNERDLIENPYLALKVDHGAPKEEWRAAWMAIKTSKDADLDEVSAANEARDRIMALEKEESDGLGRVYVVPLDNRFVAYRARGGEGDIRAPSEILRRAALYELLKSVNT